MSNIRDVAKEAGVSISTASRILSNDENFRTTEQTKQKVLEAVKKLDYQFHPRKKNVPKLTIGCILPLTSEKYSDPFFTSILLSAETELNQHQPTEFILRNFNDLNHSSVLQDFCNTPLDGLLIMEEITKDLMAHLSRPFPNIVTIDQIESTFNSVGFDHYAANMQIMKHLLNNGYRKIAYIGGSAPGLSFYDSLRMVAYREALRVFNISYDDSIIKDCEWNLTLCAKYAEDLLLSENRPDVIFAGSDTLATVILGVIYQLGMKCPDDIGVIGFNNLDTSVHTIPPLTTVDVPTKAIGKLAAKRLLDLINNRDSLVINVSLPTSLIVRDSTRSSLPTGISSP